MSDENKAVDDSKSVDSVPSAETEKADTDAQNRTVPIERFNEINNQLKDERKRLKALEDAQSQRDADKKKADEKTLEDQQAFKELADKRATELEEATNKSSELQASIEKTSEELEKYKAAVMAILETQRADVSEHVVELLDKLNPLEQMEWLGKSGTELKKSGSVPSSPKPEKSSDGKQADMMREARQFIRSSF